MDESVAQIIRYISATPDHQYLVGKTLKLTEGITPEVFVAPEAAQPSGDVPPDEPPKEPAAEAKEGEGEAKKEGTADSMRVVYRPEVTREPRMKFFKVPRLGCYLAVSLVYSSCLSTEALDSALVDYAAYEEQKKKNEEIMKEYEDRLAQDKAEQEEQEPNKSVNKSKSVEKGEPEPALDESKPPEPPKLEPLKEPEYKVKPQSFVVCLDTMGQDREFTAEEKELVTRTVKAYKQQWETREKLRLTADRKLRVEERDKDAELQEKTLQNLQEEEDKAAEETAAKQPEEMPEEDKKGQEKLVRWNHRLKHLTSGVFKDRVLALSRYNVVKMPRVMQTLYYLLGYTREELCEPETNRLFWKTARQHWNEGLLDKYQAYNPVGPKDGKYAKYQTINFLEKNLEGMAEEEVTQYSLGLGKLLECLKLTLEVRKEDILRRRDKRERLVKEREEAIQKSEQREKERAEEVRVRREEALNVCGLRSFARLGKRRKLPKPLRPPRS